MYISQTNIGCGFITFPNIFIKEGRVWVET